MADQITCAEHGQGEATFVCIHVAQTLKDGVARGFHWHVDEKNNFQALCNTCDAMDEQTWAHAVASVSTAVCIKCFQRVAALNGASPAR